MNATEGKNVEPADLEVLDRILRRQPKSRTALIPILQEAQAAYGWLPREVLRRVSDHLNLSPAAVYGVATFYAQFYLTRQGRHNVKICCGTACHVRGSARILSAIQQRFGIRPGETTPDYRFSLERVACIGSCALAPVAVLDGKVHGRMAPEKALKIIERLP